jgi:hypothetical protein
VHLEEGLDIAFQEIMLRVMTKIGVEISKIAFLGWSFDLEAK